MALSGGMTLPVGHRPGRGRVGPAARARPPGPPVPGGLRAFVARHSWTRTPLDRIQPLRRTTSQAKTAERTRPMPVVVAQGLVEVRAAEERRQEREERQQERRHQVGHERVLAGDREGARPAPQAQDVHERRRRPPRRAQVRADETRPHGTVAWFLLMMKAGWTAVQGAQEQPGHAEGGGVAEHARGEAPGGAAVPQVAPSGAPRGGRPRARGAPCVPITGPTSGRSAPSQVRPAGGIGQGHAVEERDRARPGSPAGPRPAGRGSRRRGRPSRSGRGFPTSRAGAGSSR